MSRMSAPVYALAGFCVKTYSRASISRQEDTGHSIGNDFLDLGAGNS